MKHAKVSARPTALRPLAHSIDTTAGLLGVGRTSVYELINDGQLLSFHIGKRHLITDDQVRQLIQRRMEAANAA